MADDPRYPLARKPDRDKFKEMHRDGQTVTDSAEGGGYTFTRALATRRPRSWEFGYTQVPDVDQDALRVWVDTIVFGEAVIFVWTHPLTGTEYRVRFKKGGLPQYSYEAYSDVVVGNLWSITNIQIEEA